MSDGKSRLDQQLVNLGYFTSRAQAAAAIKAGQVVINGAAARKASQSVMADDVITATPAHAFVSRGGLKLEKGLAHFGYSARDKVAVDIGASTGGFSDVLLQNRAAHVYAVDVGHDQLHEKLRADARVVDMAGVNARHLTAREFDQPLEVLVCDASFISLTLVLEAVLPLIGQGGWMLALIKPQFEVGKKNLGKNGVVTDGALRDEACARIENWLAAHSSGWAIDGIIESPITGPQGNIEFLLGARKK